MKNFHLPLPEQTYTGLRAEAERRGVPATTLAREAVDWWLRQQVRKARDEANAAHATEKAGKEFAFQRHLATRGRARPSIGGCDNKSERQGTMRSRPTPRKWRERISISTPIWSPPGSSRL